MAVERLSAFAPEKCKCGQYASVTLDDEPLCPQCWRALDSEDDHTA